VATKSGFAHNYWCVFVVSVLISLALVIFFSKVLARIYFSITGKAQTGVGGEKMKEKHFLFPTKEMEAKTPCAGFR
jgi:hypothetical protein